MAKEKKGMDWDYCCCPGGVGKLVVGLLILVIGLGWLGNELKWWAVNVPWLPLIVALVGVAMVVTWFMKRR